MHRKIIVLLVSLLVISAIFVISDVRGKQYDSALIVSQEDMEALFDALQKRVTESWEITPKAVSDATDWRIFTVESQYSYLLADGELYMLCGYWGGWGVTSAVPWDYDKNGIIDLLYTYSWGSGMHRSHVAIFDMGAKQEVTLSAIYAQFDEDAVVLPSAPGTPDRFPVYLTEASRSFDSPTRFLLKKEIGVVTMQDGQPIYIGPETVD